MRPLPVACVLAIGSMAGAQSRAFTEERRQAIKELEEGLAQHASKAVAVVEETPQPEQPQPGATARDLGLLLLAYLADGNTLRQGMRKELVRTMTKALQDRQLQDGSWSQSLEEHAIATLAMVHTYGLSTFPPMRERAQRGANYLWSAVTAAKPPLPPAVAGWAALVVDAAARHGLKVEPKLAARWVPPRVAAASQPTGTLVQAEELLCLIMSGAATAADPRVRDLVLALADAGLRDAGPRRSDDLRIALFAGMALRAMGERPEAAAPWAAWCRSFDEATRGREGQGPLAKTLLEHRGGWSREIGVSGLTAVTSQLLALRYGNNFLVASR